MADPPTPLVFGAGINPVIAGKISPVAISAARETNAHPPAHISAMVAPKQVVAPPLVPYDQLIKGGGFYPTGTIKTLPAAGRMPDQNITSPQGFTLPVNTPTAIPPMPKATGYPGFPIPVPPPLATTPWNLGFGTWEM